MNPVRIEPGVHRPVTIDDVEMDEATRARIKLKAAARQAAEAVLTETMRSPAMRRLDARLRKLEVDKLRPGRQQEG